MVESKVLKWINDFHEMNHKYPTAEEIVAQLRMAQEEVDLTTKTLYYVADKANHLSEPDDEKLLSVYEVLNGRVEHLYELECEVQDNSEEFIENYLRDNGFGDTLFNLIEL